MNIFKVIIAAVCLLSYMGANGQNQNESCTCTQVFNNLTTKLEADYIGYHLRKKEIEKSYEDLKAKYKSLSQQTKPENCSMMLMEYLSFFKDEHLFVSEFPDFSEEDMAKTKAEVKDEGVTDISHITFSKNPIEGYWTDGTSKFAIVKNTNKNIPNEYVAIIIDDPDKTTIGEIKVEVTSKNNAYEGRYYTKSYTSRYVKISAGKEAALLSLWGGITWGRLKDKNDSVYDPDLPSFRKIDDKTSLLTIPSFLIEAEKFNKVLLDNEDALRNTENLIIDIRGNTGGNAIYFPLLSLFSERPLVSEVGFTVASEDNLNYFKKISTDAKNDPYKPVVEAINNKMGVIIDGPKFEPIDISREKSKINKVVILTDRSNKSAAESFVLHAKAVSTKVITMGENTAGVIDYNNVNMVPLNCQKTGIYFGYPTFTYNKMILTNGYNKTGITPDVKIGYTVSDKIDFILKYLKQ